MASAKPKRTEKEKPRRAEKEEKVNKFSQILNFIIDFGIEIFFYGISISYFFSLQSVSFGRTCGSSAWTGDRFCH